MAEARCYGNGYHLDIKQIIAEAKRRWLRPEEICAFLRNYKKFQVSAEPPYMPQSGSFFLYDRNVLRNYRKDGHNWRKKEGHETLQAGTPSALKCYYAHGEGNKKFRRRCYWMDGKEPSHIVFVHYLDVTGNTSNSVKEYEAAASHSSGIGENTANHEIQSPVSSIFSSNSFLATGTTSPNSARHQNGELKDLRDVNESHMHSNSISPINWERVEHGNGVDVSNLPSQGNTNTSLLGSSSLPQHQLISMVDFSPNWAYANSETKVLIVGRFLSSPDVIKNCRWSCMFGEVEVPAKVIADGVLRCYTPRHEAGKISFYVTCSNRLACSEVSKFEFRIGHVEYSGQASKSLDSASWEDIYLKVSIDMESTQIRALYSSTKNDPTGQLLDDNLHEKKVLSDIRKHLLDGSSSEDGLKKPESLKGSTSKELDDVLEVDKPNVQSSPRADMGTVANGNLMFSNLPEGKTNTSMPGPSLSQDQFFSIVDFSPKWADVGSETEVQISGRFLKSPDYFKWSCMFGEEEVPAEVVADGVLRCHTPKHEAGWVPFYVTCSNRLACSEVQGFEYRAIHSDYMNTADDNNSTSQNLILRFGELISLSSYFTDSGTHSSDEISKLSGKINSLLMEGTLEWDEPYSQEKFLSEKEELNQKRLKEKLRIWLLQKAAEDGEGPRVWDKGGQGVLHFAAALGFDWAFDPTIVAGVNVNFRDENGWTALHWAASCGRERAVASLLSLGADPGLVTDPSPTYPLGRSPADLASANGHKGIAGYLAEISLSSFLKRLTLDSREGIAAGSNAPKDFSERSPSPFSFGIASDGQSVEDPLAVVRNATQAFFHIHQHYRVQSFRKRQSKEYGSDIFRMSDDHTLSLVVAKSNKRGQKVEPSHAAAIRVQNKFRSWKCRREFLTIREQVVKIQSHIRGHLVRKHYRKLLLTFGILKKVLQWRRKGNGLCGFKPEALSEAPNMLERTSKDDDDDFLKEGRKRAEEMMQRALARVKSMVQYPESRDQYLRLLNIATEIQAKKVYLQCPSNYDKDLMDIEAWLDDEDCMFQAP